MIDSFDGSYRYLSNFWGCRVEFDGATYPSVENAYQAAKTLDLGARKPFEICSASEAKRFGKKLELREDWEDVKLDIMYQLVNYKFLNNTNLEVLLASTNNEELIEGNYWGDTFWGVCNGEGENHLGRILMRVRHELINLRALKLKLPK